MNPDQIIIALYEALDDNMPSGGAAFEVAQNARIAAEQYLVNNGWVWSFANGEWER